MIHCIQRILKCIPANTYLYSNRTSWSNFHPLQLHVPISANGWCQVKKKSVYTFFLKWRKQQFYHNSPYFQLDQILLADNLIKSARSQHVSIVTILNVYPINGAKIYLNNFLRKILFKISLHYDGNKYVDLLFYNHLQYPCNNQQMHLLFFLHRQI